MDKGTISVYILMLATVSPMWKVIGSQSVVDLLLSTERTMSSICRLTKEYGKLCQCRLNVSRPLTPQKINKPEIEIYTEMQQTVVKLLTEFKPLAIAEKRQNLSVDVGNIMTWLKSIQTFVDKWMVDNNISGNITKSSITPTSTSVFQSRQHDRLMLKAMLNLRYEIIKIRLALNEIRKNVAKSGSFMSTWTKKADDVNTTGTKG
ncbi:uncharacterized protein LOC124433913 isoform X2 [Xenia sp. Carnegie-2017]|uniref:uncharacterized protein LOC124433913 isoform X2 n=1 Tax=Xenia sp. Carnegie-2017 TaxID=2897299 RepID=UPI001F037C7E|nr:uncharacterized protein LOC124433913 isoform X2 [Xenia sp. Carnegie-2017]